MHILIFAIVIIFLIYLLLKTQNKTGKSSESESENLLSNGEVNDTELETPKFHPFFISQGKLFRLTDKGEIAQIQSKHVQELSDKLERQKQRHGWKQDTAWETSFTGMKKPANQTADTLDVKFTSVLNIDNSRIMYFLKDESFGGLFLFDPVNDSELRLIHKQNLNYTDLSKPNESGQILCSSFQESGVGNIVLMEEDGGATRELTGGDTIDSAPQWIKNEKCKVVYQSQGLARSAEGYVVACGPSSINVLDTETGDLTSVFNDDNTDYLKPQVAQNGDLYFIRRPYETPSYGPFTVITDALLFPFRLLRAVFHYLNFFSLMYSRKPLTSASGPHLQKDIKNVLVKGKVIEAEKALKKERRVNGVPSLVPSSWELIRCEPGGNKQILARNVSSFCLGVDDRVIYTNGFGIFYINKAGKIKSILKEKLIEEFAV